MEMSQRQDGDILETTKQMISVSNPEKDRSCKKNPARI